MTPARKWPSSQGQVHTFKWPWTRSRSHGFTYDLEHYWWPCICSMTLKNKVKVNLWPWILKGSLSALGLITCTMFFRVFVRSRIKCRSLFIKAVLPSCYLSWSIEHSSPSATHQWGISAPKPKVWHKHWQEALGLGVWPKALEVVFVQIDMHDIAILIKD